MMMILKCRDAVVEYSFLDGDAITMNDCHSAVILEIDVMHGGVRWDGTSSVDTLIASRCASLERR